MTSFYVEVRGGDDGKRTIHETVGPFVSEFDAQSFCGSLEVAEWIEYQTDQFGGYPGVHIAEIISPEAWILEHCEAA